ncbi:Y-family DNA polymerase [Amaricoccus macauensis]|uniref:Y-family DNA polymerase n=1 Tax=Amaricoccus macauensis TaxID=57001 RepID=UPI003C7B4E74
MERWLREAARQGQKPPAELPLALAREGTHGPVVHALNPAARTLGLTTGGRVVDMRALCPDLLVRDADLAGDAEALAQLAHWVRRWAPWSSVEGTDGIALETTGSDHLWGGETAMLAEMESRLGAAGLSLRPAIAPTRGAAWALARHGSPAARVCPEGGLETALAPLPVEALRITGATALLLRRLGLGTIGRLIDIPRAALARRFGQDGSDLPLRLDQALGRMQDPLDAPEDPDRPVARIDLPETVQDPVPHLPELARRLCDRLREAGLGLRRMQLRLYRVDGEMRSVAIACARASRDAAHLTRLFDGRLDGLDPGCGFDLLTLEALATEPLPAIQSHLTEGGRRRLPLPDLVDRLAARFGSESLHWPTLRESHLPERAETARHAFAPEALCARQPMREHAPPGRERPLRLIDPPEEIGVIYAVPDGPPLHFTWRRRPYRVTRQQGPERIAPEWWRDRPQARLRDYFKTETAEGPRFWIYREGLHHDGRGPAPLWFLHGIFP